MTTTIVVPFAGCGLLNMNDRSGWRTRAAHVKAWRTTARYASTNDHIAGSSDWNGQALGPSVVACVIDVPDRRRRDPHNLYPTVKACIDGMVDAGVFDDDDATHLTTTEPTFRVVARNTPRYITFTITARECPDCHGVGGGMYGGSWGSCENCTGTGTVKERT